MIAGRALAEQKSPTFLSSKVDVCFRQAIDPAARNLFHAIAQRNTLDRRRRRGAFLSRARALAQRTPAGLTGVDPDDTSNRIDLNSCTLEQLQSLPGLSPDIGARIMAGRPYQSFDDLARDSIPLSTIARIRPLVTLGPLVPEASPKPRKRGTDDADALRRPAGPLDLNTATSAELDACWGFGPRWPAGSSPAGRIARWMT